MPCIFRILNYIFNAYLNFTASGQWREIIAYLPEDTESSIIDEIKNAEELEILDKNGNVIATHRLLGWRKVEQNSSNGKSAIIVTWATVSITQFDKMTEKIEALEKENKSLKEENDDLIYSIFEIARIVGREKEE